MSHSVSAVGRPSDIEVECKVENQIGASRTLVGAKGIATRSKDATRAADIATRNKGRS